MLVKSLLSVWEIVIPVNSSFAYLDPGTGSVVLQAAIAGFLGALFALKAFWGKIKAFFAGLFVKK